MRGALAPLAVFGFGVGCFGTVDWILSYSALANMPAVVAGPQLIVMALQALLGFLLLALCIGLIEIDGRLDRLTKTIEAANRGAHTTATPQSAPAATTPIWDSTRNWGKTPLVRPLPDEPQKMDALGRKQQALRDLEAASPMMGAGATILVIIAVVAGVIVLLAALHS